MQISIVAGPPPQLEFSLDFTAAVEKLRRLQAGVASSTDRQYLIEGDGPLPVLCFTSPFFETKVCSCALFRRLSDSGFPSSRMVKEIVRCRVLLVPRPF